jgi:hypothetical protein
VGYAIFGFGFSVTGDIALTYLTDCYPEVSEAINSGTTDKLTKHLQILPRGCSRLGCLHSERPLRPNHVRLHTLDQLVWHPKYFHLCRSNVAGYDYYAYRAAYLG